MYCKNMFGSFILLNVKKWWRWRKIVYETGSLNYNRYKNDFCVAYNRYKNDFCVAYMRCNPHCDHQIYLFVHETKSFVTWFTEKTGF